MDSRLARRIKLGVNPFLEKLFNYPSRVFPGFDLDKDKQALHEAIRTKELIVEFGSGSGKHLIALAQRYPNHAVIGFEIRFKRAVRTIEKAEHLNNIYVFRGRGELSAELLPEKSVKKVFINFPDPWDKKRWLKHRLLSSRFFNQIACILDDSAEISVKTDHLEYFEDFLNDISEDRSFKVFEYTRNLALNTVGDESILTEFESMFRAQGKLINFALVKFTRDAK